MPLVSRKQARRDLGILRLRECIVGTTSMSLGAGATFGIMDVRLANTDYTNQNLYLNSFVRVASLDYRVGSFNAGSGALVSQQILLNAIQSGAEYEIHRRLSAADLDLCIDQTVLDLRVEREVGFPTVDGATFYDLSGVGSPHTIVDVGNVYVFTDPTSTVSRQRVDPSQFSLVTTATANELRLQARTNASQYIMLDAFMQLTLGAADTATINIPDRDWLLWGAAGRAYDMLIQNAPGQDVTLLIQRRAEAANAFTKKSQRWQPGVERKVSFDAPLSGLNGPGYGNWGMGFGPLSDGW